MRIYWTLKSIPELATLPKHERGRIWRVAYGKTFNHWQTWAALLFLGLCSAIGSHFGSPEDMLGAALGGFIYGQVATQMAIPYIRQTLSRNQEGR